MVIKLFKKDNPEKLNEIGISLAEEGKYEEALEYFDKALKLNPKCVDSWYNKGLALNRLDGHEKALFCYDKSLELDSEEVNIWNNRGGNFRSVGEV